MTFKNTAGFSYEYQKSPDMFYEFVVSITTWNFIF